MRIATVVILRPKIDVHPQLFAEVVAQRDIDDQAVARAVLRVVHDRTGDREAKASGADDRYRHRLCRQRGERVTFPVGAQIHQICAQLNWAPKERRRPG